MPIISKERLVWVAVTACLAVLFVLAASRNASDATLPNLQVQPDGTYQYLHIDGPLLLEWHTGTGQARICLIRQTGIDCR